MADICKIVTGYAAGHIVIRKNDEGQPMVCAHFLDMECDPFVVEFQECGEIIIHPGEFKYLMIDRALLQAIDDVFEVAHDTWAELQAFCRDDPDDYHYVGWEGMITPPPVLQ